MTTRRDAKAQASGEWPGESTETESDLQDVGAKAQGHLLELCVAGHRIK